MLKKDTPFELSKTQESSFNQLKEALIKAPILVFSQFTDPFLLCTDASTIGVGAALMQTDSAGKRHVIAFASRALTPAEKKLFSYPFRGTRYRFVLEAF